MSEAAVIVAMGANTVLGQDAWTSAAAVRAGVSGFMQHPYMVDTTGEPMCAAIAPYLDIALSGVDRFEALLAPAIEQVAAVPLDRATGNGRWALALGLPSARPGLPQELATALLIRMRSRFGAIATTAATFESGHAGGLIALQAALQKLRSGHLDGCVVAAVDSWIEPATLEWLERCDQVHGAGPLNNAWGFVPGEASAALLMVRESVAKAWRLQPLATVAAVGTAHEAKRIKTETVCIGEGLTSAFRATLAALPRDAQVSDIYCDMNGEPYRADEFGFAALRTKEHFESLADFIAPADCWGDVSAAGGLLHVQLACAAAHKQYSRGSDAFVWASAETGERAAALLACAGPGARRI